MEKKKTIEFYLFGVKEVGTLNNINSDKTINILHKKSQ